MITTYEAKAAATCPIDGAIIDYDVRITLSSPGRAMIYVESILDVLARATAAPITQEALTEALGRAWPEAAIETVGRHSAVRVRCAVGPQRLTSPAHGGGNG